MSKKSGPVRAYVEELLTAVSFIDINGRKIGFDYLTIAQMVAKKFPNSRLKTRARQEQRGITTRKFHLLQDWYMPRARRQGLRFPVRYRSRRLLARDYARALLIEQTDNVGLTLETIRRRVRKRFPEIPALSLGHVEAGLRLRGYEIPSRIKP